VAAADAAAGQPDHEAHHRHGRFFGVPPTYFLQDDAMQRDGAPDELAAVLGDDKVREMALRAAGLSGRSLKSITDMIDSARTAEGRRAA
jgi:hypothetical protein